MDFDVYYGERKYRTWMAELEKIEYTENQKYVMLRDILDYADKKDFRIYHDLLNDISESHMDWYNMLAFTRKKKRIVLDYIKDKVRGNRK